MIEEIVKVAKGNGLPLGVSKVGRNQWQFSVAMERGKKYNLLLFRTGEKQAVYSLPLNQEYLVGGIYSVIIGWKDSNITEYCYQVDKKLYLDPYARQLVGSENFGKANDTEERCVRCRLMEQGKVVSEPLHVPFHELILYRLHVRGYTMHASSKVKNRGTYKGLEEKIPYLNQLGVNGIVLLPCYEFDEQFIGEERESGPRAAFLDYTKPITEEQEKKQEFPKVNFWGYTKRNCYFAPKASYASNSNQPIREMKHMVKKMHDNGISVFMEIYFSDNINQTLILDCLRYWVSEYGIDGFKINTEVVNSQLIAKDPLLARTKLLTTYWNTADFYSEYEKLEEKTLAEYNDGFMVDCRRFLKSDEGQINAFLGRMRKNPNQQAVINYISNTDGFTLMDLVSYDVKHNDANGEQSMDGTEYNYSWNCGWEGPTRKKQIARLRLRQIKNALIFLMLSQGVPMLLAGDEFGNTQKGNNNAYCQDNEIGWVTWNKQVMNQRILAFTKKLIALRKDHPVFRPKNELRGMDYIACGCPDISFHGTKPWYPDLSNYSRVIGVMLYGKYAPLSVRTSDKSFYIAYNMHWEEHKFELPVLPKNKKWKVIVDTNELNLDFADTIVKEEQVETKKKQMKTATKENGILEYVVKPRTVVVFEEV